jgi:hypothetical protein
MVVVNDNYVEATLRRMQALERCHIAFGRAPNDELAELPPIRRLYAKQLPNAPPATARSGRHPVEGYIVEDA